jgi:outer membrane receptor protein involved in Fe transport
MQAQSSSVATMTSADSMLKVDEVVRKITEFAVFGEATIPIAPRLNATLGARLFETIAEDEATERAGGKTDSISKTILSPSVAVSWKAGDGSLVYLRYARALRPGGLAPAGDSIGRRFESDELGTIDFGVRHAPSADFALNASLFYTRWNNIQSDFLLADGLVSTRNAGRARITGAEADVEWRPGSRLLLSAGASYVDAVLVRTEDGTKLDDRRLPVTPDLTGRFLARYDFPLSGWDADATFQANYVGSARLSFDPDIDRPMGDFATFSVGASVTRDALTFSAGIQNLFDAKGDSFSFGNPFSIMASRQFTPLRPRTFSLSFTRRW